jgi:hypothetical protein
MDYRPTNGDVACRKSAFCFGDRLTFVTSAISRSSKDAQPVVTTLCQNRLGEALRLGLLDGQPLTGTQRLAADRLHWLLDSRGNGYVVHAGGGTLVAARREQEWLYLYKRYLKDPAANPKALNSTKLRWIVPGSQPEQVLPTPRGAAYPPAVEAYYQPSRGTFETVWLDHGAAPDAASDNAYTLLPQTTPAALAALATALADEATAPYRLVRRTGAAHVLYDRPSATWAYACFEAGPPADRGPLTSVSRPCFVMLRRSAEGLALSAASSDATANGADGVDAHGGPDWPPAGQPLALTLAGAWRVAGRDNEACAVTAEPAAGGTRLTLRLPWRLPLVVRLAAQGLR